MNPIESLNIHIYADGADKAGMVTLYNNTLIKGLTTNPTLMRKAGIGDYETFARDILETITTKPISFEVFSDDFAEMRREAIKISEWQDNVFVKIPITNTHGESAQELIRDLAHEGVQLNVTALLTTEQVETVAAALNPEVAAVVSVFAGRIADTGRDPSPAMKHNLTLLKHLPKAQLLWASVREVLNIFQADAAGSHIVTVPHDILHKALKMAGQDLGELSLDTVRMFARDASEAGFKL